MARHDLLVFHTMAGYLHGADTMFRQGGYTGLESHFGTGWDGTLYQWQDTDWTADANMNGNPRIISVENEDSGSHFAPWKNSSDVPDFTDQQLAVLIDLTVWACVTHDIPCVEAKDSKPTTRGIGWHRLGIDPWRVPGGELWSTSKGKVCPGDRRIAQIKTIIIPEAAKKLSAPKPVPTEGDTVQAFCKLNSSPAVYITDFVNGRRGVVDLPYKQKMIQAGVKDFVWGFDTIDGLNAFGGRLLPNPDGSGTTDYNPTTKKWETHA